MDSASYDRQWTVARDGTVELAEPAESSPLREEKPLWRKLVRLLWLPFLIVWKGKAVFVALAKVKGLTTLASMLVSVGAYALIWGWVFAAGFVALLFIHELGHAVVLRRQGIKTSPIVFLPFLGAVIAMKSMPKDAYKEAQMALGGPILGSLGALACLLASYATGSDLLQALAYTGFLLNLFNLIPVVPLDGGRAVAAVHPGIWYAGVVLLIGVIVWWHAWVLLALCIFFLFPELVRRLREQRQEAVRQNYYGLSTRTRIGVGATYAALALSLGAGMYISHLPRTLDGKEPGTAVAQKSACIVYQDGEHFIGGTNPPKEAVYPELLELETHTDGDDVLYAVEGEKRERVDLSACLSPARP